MLTYLSFAVGLFYTPPPGETNVFDYAEDRIALAVCHVGKFKLKTGELIHERYANTHAARPVHSVSNTSTTAK
jgi:hypothetical protein